MASPASKKHGGKEINIPGAYTQTTYTSNVLGVLSTKQLFLVGESEGGRPEMVHAITSSSQARIILQGGLLLEAALTALDASPLGSPGVIYVWNIAKLKQSSAKLLKNSDTIITVKSAEYGSRSNQLSVEIKDNGDTVIVKRLDTLEKIENLHTSLFNVSSTLAGAKFEIKKDKAIYTENSNATEYLFSDYPTVAELVLKLEETTNISVVLLGDGNWETSKIDTLTSVVISTNPVVVTGNLYRLAEALENSDLIESAEVNTSLATIELPPDQVVNLVGGSKGSAVTGIDWANNFDSLMSYNVGILIPCTTNNNIMAIASTHAIKASSSDVNKDRMVFCGGVLNETIDDVITESKALNSEKTARFYAPEGMYGRNVLSPAAPKKLYNSLFFAIKVGAMISAQPDNFVATNKVIAALDFGKRLMPIERTKLLIGSVIAGVYDDNDLTIVERAITTSQSQILAKEEIVSQLALHTISKDLRISLNKALIGSPSTLPRKSTAETIFETRYQKWLNELQIVNSFNNLNVVAEGDLITLSVDLAIITGTNFVLITLNISV